MKTNKAANILIALILLATNLHAQTITTVVGCGIGDDSIATKAELCYPRSVAIDAVGDVYISDALNNRIRKVKTVANQITTFAGTGVYGNSGDGGLASAANMEPGNIVFDKNGNLYICETYSVRKINTAGIITTIAGTGASGFSGDGGPATNATFNALTDIAVDTAGNVYVADFMNNRVRRINSAGMVQTVAGSGIVGYSPDGTTATGASLNRPFSVATDRQGNFYFGEYNNRRIRKVGTTGLLATVVGNGTLGYTGDGGPATSATITAPVAIRVDTLGNLYFSDNHNYCVRKINTSGIITTIAGKGTPGYSGDGGIADSALLCTPGGLDVDRFGSVLISDLWNNRVRMVSPAGIITTLAGQNGLFGEGVPATAAEISLINNMATDTIGRLYFADTYNSRIRRLDPATGLVTTVAGDGIAGYHDGFSGDGGPADSARIYYPEAVAVDNAMNIYIADINNYRVRKVSASGIISTLAGSGVPGFSGDGGLADTATLNQPNNVAVDRNGNVYIGDNGNYRIRKVAPSGIITTFAGTGTNGFSGDGGPATAANLGVINDLFADRLGNVYYADAQNERIRKIDTFGVITTVAGNGTAGFSGDGSPATAAELSGPSGIRVDNTGAMYIADYNNGRVRKVDATGVINTIAGNGGYGFAGEGGPALAATFAGPAQLAIGTGGTLYIADAGNYRIRKMNGTVATPTIINPNNWGFSVYPNPVQDKVVLTITQAANLPAQATGTVKIYDMAGKLLASLPLTAHHHVIDLQTLPNGVYLLDISLENAGSKQIKVEKE